jgi:hypothetical protein
MYIVIKWYDLLWYKKYQNKIACPDEVIDNLKNEKPLFENEPVTSDTTLNKQEIVKQTLDNKSIFSFWPGYVTFMQ